MKNIIYFSLIAVLFVASCTSNKNGIITKRKYTKGYFVDMKSRHKHEVKEHEIAKVSKKQEVRRNVTVASQQNSQVVNEAPVITAAANDAVAVNQPSKIRTVTNAVNEQHTSRLKDSEVKPSLTQKFAARQAVKKLKKTQKGGDLDNNTILLIILSLFPILALIAMYLHDGKQITLNFWVDLILHFTVIGYLIFALLVVLDIIDLA